MAATPRNIHLLVPGLLGPMPTLDQLDREVRSPALELSLLRARRADQVGRDLESTLFALFGIGVDADYNLPTAAYRRIGDGGVADDRYWLQLSPVYLRPDQDRLLLFDAKDLDLSLDEAKQFSRLFNDHFSDEGWQVEVLDPHRWYLSLAAAPDLKTYALSDVFGRNMDLFLPQGEAGIYWRGVLNEIQMLFYTADVNAQREGEGKAPISGLWISGGGQLGAPLQTDIGAIQGDSPLLRGLAKQSGISIEPLPDEVVIPSNQEGELLICYDRLQRHVLCADPYAWREQLTLFDEWLQLLNRAVKTGRFGTLTLYPCNGSAYQITRGSLRRFWRRPHPLKRWLDHNPIL